MFWFVLLPFTITFVALLTLVVVAAWLAPRFNWKRGKTLGLSAVIACVAFIPSCMGIMSIVDVYRFGEFHYDSFADVNDFRAERYLPVEARDITMVKRVGRYYARYSISESQLTAYLDGLWKPSHPPISNDKYAADDCNRIFEEVGWPTLTNPICLISPIEDDGGGAHYFFDREAEVVYQHTGYW